MKIICPQGVTVCECKDFCKTDRFVTLCENTRADVLLTTHHEIYLTEIAWFQVF